MANKPMFWAGLILIIITAALLFWNLTGETTSPIVLGIIGIVSMGASKYRPMEGRK